MAFLVPSLPVLAFFLRSFFLDLSYVIPGKAARFSSERLKTCSFLFFARLQRRA